MSKLQTKINDISRVIRTSKIWKAIFRHTYQDNPRNRSLMILSNVFLHILPVKVRPSAIRFRYTWRLGEMSFFLFLLLTLTGVMLMFYYRPTIEHAYWDMKDLRFVVPFGPILRNMHRWAAHVMVLLVMFHMASVFYRSAYKPPREFNWVVGVILLLITFLLSFTGYLLPWDQLAIWAVTVGTNMAANTPILGSEGPFAIVGPDMDARFILLGSKIVGQSGLLRFYVLHCVFLPVIFIGYYMRGPGWELYLPWDQLAIWAVTVGTNMAANTPILGSEGPFSIVGPDMDARFILLGSKIVGQSGLLRFYVLHCVFLPVIFIVFVSVHLWRVRKDDFSAVPVLPKEERRKGTLPEEWLKKNPAVLEKKVFTWPNLVSRQFVAALVLLAILTAWSLLAHAPLEELANPNKTPNPSKAPWYFVGLQELLVYFDPWMAGVVLPTLILVGLMAIPFLDINPIGVGYYNFKNRKFAVGMFTFGLVLWFGLIFIGYYMRGPGWELYLPWEKWDHFRPTSQLGLHNMPNLLGIGFVLIYGAVGMLLPKILFKDFYKSLGPIKYVIVMALVLFMFFVPVKILLRNVFKIKYLVSFPDFNLNL